MKILIIGSEVFPWCKQRRYHLIRESDNRYEAGGFATKKDAEEWAIKNGWTV